MNFNINNDDIKSYERSSQTINNFLSHRNVNSFPGILNKNYKNKARADKYGIKAKQ